MRPGLICLCPAHLSGKERTTSGGRRISHAASGYRGAQISGFIHCRADMGRVLVASLCSFSPTLLLSHYRWSASSLRFLPLPVPWHGPSHSSHTAQRHPGAQKRGRSWWSSSWWDKTMAQWKCPPCKWVSRGNTASWELRWKALPLSSPEKGYSALGGDPKKGVLLCCIFGSLFSAVVI